MDRLQLPALFPLERCLGIVAGVATPALADLVARLSVNFTQRQVLETIIHLSGRTICCVPFPFDADLFRRLAVSAAPLGTHYS